MNLAKRDAAEALRLLTTDNRLSKEERKVAVSDTSVYMPHTQATADMLVHLPDQTVTAIALSTTVSYWAEKD